MPSLSKIIVDSVDEKYIIQYLKKHNIVYSDDDQGKEVNYWVDELFKENKVDIGDFENFLFDELFYGKRKYSRMYRIEKPSSLSNPIDWFEKYQRTFGIDVLDFTNILGSVANSADPMKIAASVSEINSKGDLISLKILFSCYAECSDKGDYAQTGMYYPVEVNLENKELIIRGWNRQGLLESYRAEEAMDHIHKVMDITFGVRTTSYSLEHRKVLYNMSQGVITDIYNKIPSYSEMSGVQLYVLAMCKSVVNRLPLKNRHIVDSEYCLNDGVLDFEDELNKTIEKLCVSDFFFDMPYESVWKMGVDTIISRIKFKDTEHVLTSLNGETSDMPIFCTKTFLALKKSLEESELVERIWIQKERKRGKMELGYDATKDDYLGIRVLSDIRFKEEDFVFAKEIYRKYERGVVTTLKTENQQDAV